MKYKNYNNIQNNNKTSSFSKYSFKIALILLVLTGIFLTMINFYPQLLRGLFNRDSIINQIVETKSKSIAGQEFNQEGEYLNEKNKNLLNNQFIKEATGYGIAAGGGLTYLSQEDLDKYFASLQSLGVAWVRWDIDWSVVERDGQGKYDWSGTDRVVKTANRYGINSLGIIAYAPKWASEKGCRSDNQCAPADTKIFAYFAGEVVNRYRDSIKYWEIWNEPNFSSFWGPKTDVKKYTEVLKGAYTEIKKVNPDAVVLSGGLAPSYNERNGSLSPITFVNNLYTNGAGKYFDAIALHPYSYPALPQYKIYWNSWQQMISIRDIMVKNGDVGKKIWITEYGAPTGGPGAGKGINKFNFNHDIDFMIESAQKDMMIDALSFYNKNQDWLGPFFWYSLKDRGNRSETSENFFGLLRYDGSKKPAYDVFKEAIENSKK